MYNFVLLFLADRTIGRAFGTVSRLSVVVCLSVCDVLYCGKTVHPSEKAVSYTHLTLPTNREV